LSLEDFDDFGEEVLERHGAGVGNLGAAHEFGLEVGWDEFEDLDAGGLRRFRCIRQTMFRSTRWIALWCAP
jgi:hypothetical protein